MKSILIKDTTREEREQIVRRSLWGDCGIECEFCSITWAFGTFFSLFRQGAADMSAFPALFRIEIIKGLL